MKANELRIGNLVLEKRKCKISGICGMPDKDTILDVYRSVNGVYDNYVVFDDFPTTMPIEALSPIPLTEELLLRCGFEKSVDSYSVGGVTLVLLNDAFSLLHGLDFDVFNAIIKFKNCEVEHLHQLQNLYFSLTGEELDVKLD